MYFSCIFMNFSRQIFRSVLYVCFRSFRTWLLLFCLIVPSLFPFSSLCLASCVPSLFLLLSPLFPFISSIFHLYSLKAFTKFEIGPQETECRTAAFRHSVSWSPIGPFHAHSIVVATTTLLSPNDTYSS